VYGRFNTRLFKYELRQRNRKIFEPLQLDPEFERAQPKIHDPTAPDFFQRMLGESLRYEPPAHMARARVEEHELYKPEKCYLFDGTRSMTDGVDQACSLINATAARPFPTDFFTANLPANLLPEDYDWHVQDAIMHGERYDPTMVLLPKRFDPIIWWNRHPRVHGSPVTQRA